jgi:glutaconate CoA-transferase, subunit A
MPTLSRPIYTDPDKRKTLDDLASLVTDGAVVAVGGGLSSREPMALLRAILRRRATGLTVVGSAHGIDIDLLCAGGALSRSSESYVGFEQDFGQAPNYRRALESGAVKTEDSCCYTLVQQLRAAIQGLPFMPMRSVRGTSFPSLHPEYRQMVCPFTGEELLLVPAIEPDVALIHAQ